MIALASRAPVLRITTFSQVIVLLDTNKFLGIDASGSASATSACEFTKRMRLSTFLRVKKAATLRAELISARCTLEETMMRMH